MIDFIFLKNPKKKKNIFIPLELFTEIQIEFPISWFLAMRKRREKKIKRLMSQRFK